MEFWQKILIIVAAACTALLFVSGLNAPHGNAVSSGENRGVGLNDREKDIYVSPGGYAYDMGGRLVKTTGADHSDLQVKYEYTYNQPSIEDVLEAFRQMEEQRKHREPPRID
jgi:hypothetical protein